MKIGILNAVPSKFLIDHQTDPEKFAQLFRSIGAAVELSTYEAAEGELPESVEACDVFLITGSPQSVYDDEPWIAGLERFIQHCYAQRRRLVGVCFGHQLIAQALGGQVVKSAAGWVLGLHEVSLHRQKLWLSPEQSRCSLYFINEDQVVTMPPRAELIGGNELCPYTIFAIDKQVLCIQAHPEQPERFLRLVTDYLGPRVSPETRHTALASLDNGMPDGELVGGWMLKFIST
jgi:GMP synthase (glutamine-hydrolysing)